MARAIQVTAHIPPDLLARIDAEARGEEEATNRLTKEKGAHVPRNAMIVALLKKALGEPLPHVIRGR